MTFYVHMILLIGFSLLDIQYHLVGADLCVAEGCPWKSQNLKKI